jgi:hypothetical protein
LTRRNGRGASSIRQPSLPGATPDLPDRRVKTRKAIMKKQIMFKVLRKNESFWVRPDRCLKDRFTWIGFLQNDLVLQKGRYGAKITFTTEDIIRIEHVPIEK